MSVFLAARVTPNQIGIQRPVLSSHLPSRNTRRNLTRTLCLLRSTALPHQPDLLLIRLPFR